MSKIPDKLQKQEQQLFSEAMTGIVPIRQDKIIPSSENNRVFVAQTNFLDNDKFVDNLSDQYDPFDNDQQRNELNYHHVSISKKQFRALKKGLFRRGQGILRQALNIWLRQLPEVLAFTESPEHSGGKGVIRLLLAALSR